MSVDFLLEGGSLELSRRARGLEKFRSGEHLHSLQTFSLAVGLGEKGGGTRKSLDSGFG